MTAASASAERCREIADAKPEKYRVSGSAARLTRRLLRARPDRYVRRVTPDELKALRKDLACTAKELAAAIGLEQSTVMAWEKGELFPTKPYIDKMNALRAKGPGAIPKKSKGGDPMQQLRDPLVWELLRKIAAHKKLRDEVAKLAAGYPDPADAAEKPDRP
jgi:DNA-binding transcriptional regulator YiaG